ncbi:MAG: hypothetical protein RLZ55_391 [Actinomycetota bacterium]
MIAVLRPGTRGFGSVGALIVLVSLLLSGALTPTAAHAAEPVHTLEAPTPAEIDELVAEGEQVEVAVARVAPDRRMRIESVRATGPDEAAQVVADAQADPSAVAADVARPVYVQADPFRPGGGSGMGQYPLDMLCIDAQSHTANTAAGLPACIDDAQAHASGAGQVVAVIDTGLQPSHPDLAGLLVDGATCVDGRACVAVPAASTIDNGGHGQQVAGTVNSVTGNGVALAGLAPAARLMPVRVFNDFASATTADVAAGVIWAADHGATVINISLGWADDADAVVAAAVQWALGRNVPIVAAAGNYGTYSPVVFPAAYPGVIGVGAVDSSKAAATYSSRGSWVDVMAPGSAVPVLCPNWTPGKGCTASGTSFASPEVAAVVSMMRQLRPSDSPAMIERQLQRTATRLGGQPGRSDTYGWGLVNPVRALSESTQIAITSAVGGDARATVAFSVTGAWPQGGWIEYSLDHGATWLRPSPTVTASPLVISGLRNDTPYGVRLRVVDVFGTIAESGDDWPNPDVVGAPIMTSSVGTVFVPVDPVRVISTRASNAPLAAQETRLMSVADQIGADGGAKDVVPAGAVAVAVNLTVPGGASGGHLRVMPGDLSTAPASAINFRPSESIANGQVGKVDGNRCIRLFNGSSGSAHALVDITGYFLPASIATPAQLSQGRFTPVAPVRVYDTRADPATLLEPGGTRVVSVARAAAGTPAVLGAGAEVVPAGASAVEYNITVVAPEAAGHLRVYPADREPPGASAINWAAGDKIANGLVVRLDAERRVKVTNYGGSPVRFLIDVVGYYSTVGAEFYALDPVRAYDSRAPQPSPGPLATGDAAVRTVSVADARDAAGDVVMAGIVPSGAVGIAYNLTVTAPAADGHLRLFPSGSALPSASAINWPAAGYSRANASVVQTSADLRVSIYNGGAPAHTLIDVLGYYR